MLKRPRTPIIFQKAPGFILGVFSLWACVVFTSGCKRQLIASTPQWQDTATASDSQITSQTELVTNTAVTRSDSPYTFVAYNLRNYLPMWRSVAGVRKIAGKPELEIAQLLEVIRLTKPDILGISEIGGLSDLKDLQSRLLNIGVDLPHTHHTGGSDDVRYLAILSKFPLTANPKPVLSYQIDGKEQQVRRGIADAYVHTPTGKVRLIGVHFKSKRPSQQFDQELVRKNEAFTLRKHLDTIHKNPQSANDRLLVYGDFNDTTRSTALKLVAGSFKTNGYCKILDLKCSDGTNWTHHWSYQDVYSRFDFALANKAMLPFIDPKSSHIMDVSTYPKSSDHRPLIINFH